MSLLSDFSSSWSLGAEIEVGLVSAALIFSRTIQVINAKVDDNSLIIFIFFDSSPGLKINKILIT